MEYLVDTIEYQAKVTIVMYQEDKDTDMTLVSQITEENQEYGKTVVKTILKEISFCPNENVHKEETEVLSELTKVKDFHLEGWVWNLRIYLRKRVWISITSQPNWHEGSADHDFKCPY